ncbi:helix-turn-helix domain-containing protein [Planomonospora corallina]|uniref:Helix-turn-helix domain-containing protein n=1 Tax=Planomonospora corallina TaxID=1806052 RepID=A0ABV8IEK4_9ACTN
MKKSQRELPKSVREPLSAFADIRGGVLILGLDGTRGFAATGVHDALKLSNDLAPLCSTDMEPALRPLIRVRDFEDVKLVGAEVPELDPAQRP